jgi:hypothetical protein
MILLLCEIFASGIQKLLGTGFGLEARTFKGSE